MNAPPRDYQTTYETISRHWSDLGLPKTTKNGTTLNWYFSIGGPILTRAQIGKLGKRPATQTRNFLKHQSDLLVLGKVGGAVVETRRVLTEPGWRAGIYDQVPPEVVETITAYLKEHPL